MRSDLRISFLTISRRSPVVCGLSRTKRGPDLTSVTMSHDDGRIARLEDTLLAIEKMFVASGSALGDLGTHKTPEVAQAARKFRETCSAIRAERAQ